MRLVSTRGGSESVGFSEAIARGLASDGGLYVPRDWPVFAPSEFADRPTLQETSVRLLAPFLEGDALAEELPAIIEEAFNFPVPLVELDDERGLSVLELFHGPTAAFKDFGARFLAASLARTRTSARRPLRILVATSGDTGGAVAAAFHNRPGFEVIVLFPKGLVSPAQQQQLTCWGGNVRSFAVNGTFDDCQRLVKAAFADPRWRAQCDLSSANSINLGRLLPQMTYFAWASLMLQRKYGVSASFVVPSGNLGHATACAWARQIGMPIDKIVLAHNFNRTMADLWETGEWRPRASVPTLASAMDVGDPSNAERLRHLFATPEALRSAVTVEVVEDAAIRARIVAGYERYGQAWCPHTAVGMEAFERRAATGRMRGPWVVAATAHAAKFAEIVEPLIGRVVERPPALARLFERETRFEEIPPALDALWDSLDA
jgi:threonine synthase